MICKENATPKDKFRAVAIPGHGHPLLGIVTR